MGWQSGVGELVRRHAYDFEAAAREVGATAKEVRLELARAEFGDEEEAPRPPEPPPELRPKPRPKEQAEQPGPRRPAPETRPKPRPKEDDMKWDAESMQERERAALLASRAYRDEVFGRVLAAVGGSDIEGSGGLLTGPVADSWRAAKEAEAAADAEREAKIAHMAEMRLLREERERLRRRFDVGSEDAEGIDPFADQARASPDDEEGRDFAQSADAQAHEQNFDMDALLDSLEAEYKGEANSRELEELFSLLDSAPKPQTELTEDFDDFSKLGGPFEIIDKPVPTPAAEAANANANANATAATPRQPSEQTLAGRVKAEQAEAEHSEAYPPPQTGDMKQTPVRGGGSSRSRIYAVDDAIASFHTYRRVSLLHLLYFLVTTMAGYVCLFVGTATGATVTMTGDRSDIA